MRVCVMTTAHPPDDVRINKEIKTLIKGRYEVVYIAPEGDFNPEGFEYIPIKRYLSRKERFLEGRKEIFQKAIEINADIYHFHDPELIPVGLKLKKLGKKVIYDVHEDYPSVILMKSWIPKILRYPVSIIFDIYEKNAVKKLDGIVVVTEKQAERLKMAKAMAIVPNFPDDELLENIDEIRFFPEDWTEFVYVGSIDEDRAIAEIIEAFKIVRSQYEKVGLVLVGPIYSKRLEEIIKNAGDRVIYKPRVPYQEALKITKGGDIGLLVIKKGRSKEFSSPVKMFEYMAFGLPIIASDFDYWKRFFKNYPNPVFYVKPDDTDDITSAMKKALNLRKGKQWWTYSWKNCGKELLELYRNIIRR